MKREVTKLYLEVSKCSWIKILFHLGLERKIALCKSVFTLFMSTKQNNRLYMKL